MPLPQRYHHAVGRHPPPPPSIAAVWTSGVCACMLRRMPAQGARLQLALRLTAIVLIAVAVAAVAGTGVALILAPAALLALPLLFGRYPGERVIHRIAGRIVRKRAPGCVILPRAPRSLGARAAALALPGSGRAPPAAVAI